MKYIRKLLFKKQMSNFDLLGLFFITLLAFKINLFFYVLLIPFVVISAVLDIHFEVTEKLES